MSLAIPSSGEPIRCEPTLAAGHRARPDLPAKVVNGSVIVELP